MNITINKVTNGSGITVAWAVVKDGLDIIGKFHSVEEACKFAKKEEARIRDVAKLKAIKALPAYNATKVSTLIASIKFPSELEAANALWMNNWDREKAEDYLLFGGEK